jgi:alkylation response protein AidB-like acyl-CoA dehydrogenase
VKKDEIDSALGYFENKIFTLFEGTSEIQRMLIGRTVTGLDVR